MKDAIYYSEEQNNIVIVKYDGVFKISSNKLYKITSKDFLIIQPNWYDKLFKVLSEEYTFIGYV